MGIFTSSGASKMISHIYGDKHITITSGNTTSYVPTNSNSGSVRYNTVTQTLEACSDNMWYSLQSSVSLSLSMEALRAIDWVTKKMQQDQEAVALAEKNESVKDALAQLAKAQEQLDIIVALVRDYGKQNA
jgi:hypothetical protein